MPSLTESEIESNPLFGPLVAQVNALARAVTGPEASFERVEAAALLVSKEPRKNKFSRQELFARGRFSRKRAVLFLRGS
jgi:hypothetical protein